MSFLHWLDERHERGERTACYWHLALTTLALGEVLWHGLSAWRHWRGWRRCR